VVRIPTKYELVIALCDQTSISWGSSSCFGCAHAQSYSLELHNASIAIVDEDHSELSRRITHAFLPPYFQPPKPIAERDIVPLMNERTYTFVVNIPPNFQHDVLGRRQPTNPAQHRYNYDGPCWS
jgi:hypothetical protein